MRTVLLVRHADIDLPPDGIDPALSSKGEARAEDFARVGANAGIELIIVSSLRRARETAAPLARALGVEPVEATTAPDVLQSLAAAPSDVCALVVGHSNTLPDIIRGLGVQGSIPEITESEFDNLFVVVIDQARESVLLALKYGD